MQTVYMKIHEYEEESKSLIVSFASDTTRYQDPDMYTRYAFQPLRMWPDVDDPEEIKKRIAVSGMYHAEQQEREEKFIDNQENIEKYRNMIGQVSSYSVENLAPTSSDIIEV
jgi:hypothetical protein